MISNLSISSPSVGTLRIEGVAELDHVDYLIQADATEPAPEADPTGTESVTPGTPFSFDIEGLEPGSRVVFVRDRSPEPSIYVDSEAGDDSNRGLSAASPIKTISALQAKLGSGYSAQLAGGSVWQEQIEITVLDNVSIIGLPEGAEGDLPIIDASDPIVGTWVKESGYTNVWKISHSHSFTTNQHQFPVVENGSQMIRVASIAAVDTTAGRYHCPQDESATTNPITLYIHSTDNPNTNGKEYRVPARRHAIGVLYPGATGHTIEGIYARHQGHNNGAITTGKNSAIRRCVIQGGHKHNVLQEDGLIEDSICIRASRTSPDAILHVFYAPEAAGFSGTYRRVGFIGEGTRPNATYSHDSSGPAHDTQQYEQNWYYKISTTHSSRASVLTVDGDYVYDCASVINTAAYNSNSLIRMMVRDCPARVINLEQEGPQLLSHCVSYRRTGENDLNNPTIRRFSSTGSAQITIDSCTIFSRNLNNPVFQDIGTGANTYTIRNNVFAQNSGAQIIRLSPNATNVDIDNNLYWVNSKSTLEFRVGTTAYTLEQWKALGYDTNSLFLDATDISRDSLFVSGDAGVELGDFRLRDDTGLTLPDGTPIHTLGAQSHWDWNAREPVSGAPIRWPVVPLNISESLAYAKNPTAWSFYP